MTKPQKQLLLNIAARGYREQEKAYHFPDLYSMRHLLNRHTIGQNKEFENNLKRGKFDAKHRFVGIRIM